MMELKELIDQIKTLSHYLWIGFLIFMIIAIAIWVLVQ